MLYVVLRPIQHLSAPRAIWSRDHNCCPRKSHIELKCTLSHYLYYFVQSQEFDVYINYASTYREAVSVLENVFLKNGEAVEYLKVIGYWKLVMLPLPPLCFWLHSWAFDTTMNTSFYYSACTVHVFYPPSQFSRLGMPLYGLCICKCVHFDSGIVSLPRLFK